MVRVATPQVVAPALEWFARRGWELFAFQREVWEAYLRGESGLIHAATGTGKTYAAWFGPILEWMAERGPGEARPGDTHSAAPGRAARRRAPAAPGLRIVSTTAEGGGLHLNPKGMALDWTRLAG